MAAPETESKIRTETPCIGCGYDLRGLHIDGSCPECGTSIRRSLAGPTLAYADRDWLKRVVFGQRLACIGLVMTVCGAVARWFLMLIGSQIDMRLEIDWQGRIGGVLEQILFVGAVLGGLLIAAIGFFLVTTLDPRDRDREQRTSTRQVARWGMVAAIVALGLGEVETLWPTVALQVVSDVVSLLGLVALALAVPAMLEWLAGLAQRIPDATLAERTNGLARSVRHRLVFLTACVAIQLVGRVVPPEGRIGQVVDVVEQLAGCGAGIVILLLLFSLLAIFGSMPAIARAFDAVTPEDPPAQTVRTSD